MKLYTVFIFLLLFSLIFTDNVYAQDIENPEQQVDVLTLLQINGNNTVSDTINISAPNQKTNVDIWDDFTDYMDVTGKVFCSDLPPTAVYPSSSVAWLNTMFKLSPAFFMQGLSSFWLRCPFEYLSTMGSFTTKLYSLYADDPASSARTIYEKGYTYTPESFDSDPNSSDVKVVDYIWDNGGSTFTYKFVYIKMVCPLYSDNTYKISFKTSRRPNLFFTSSDNGLDGVRWSSVSPSSFDPVGQERNISLSIDILGIYGLSDGVAGFFLEPGSDISYDIALDPTIGIGDYVTVMIPFANSFNGSILMQGQVGFQDYLWFSPDPETGFVFFSYYVEFATTTNTLSFTIHSNTSNYIWIRDLNYPMATSTILTFYTEISFLYDNSMYQQKVFFAPWINVQISDSQWVNTYVPPEYVYNYVTETTYINYEVKNTLNKESIFYGYYKFGETVYNAFTWSYETIKDTGIKIYELLPDTIKDGLKKIVNGVREAAEITLDFGNWISQEIIGIGYSSFSVGLKAYEWIIEHIPALQDLLSKLLRIVLAVTILALFTVIVFVFWKILNTMRILATSGLRPAIEYASSITIFQKATAIIGVIT